MRAVALGCSIVLCLVPFGAQGQGAAKATLTATPNVSQASVASEALDSASGKPVAKPLTLADVLAAVHRHHPLIHAERATVQAAAADARAARGEFDATLTVQGRMGVAGYYDPRRLEAVIEQPTPLWGSSVYAGYRLTRGKVPDYYGEQRTLDRGELRGGARIPLWQDRKIDARRAGRLSTRSQAESAEHAYRELLLDMEREAATAYQAWLGAGQRVAILEQLVALALARDEQVRAKVALGALPSIEQVDNQRAIVDRQRQLVLARRSLEKAAIELSLYLRDSAGRAQVPGREQLPERIGEPTIEPGDASALAAQALAERPEIKAYEASVAAARVEQKLAESRVAPRLDAFGEVSRDFGNAAPELAPTLRPTVLEVGVSFSMPLWLRKARGKLDQASAKLRALEDKASFARDKVQAEVRDALSQLAAARERAELARRGAEAALQVAAGERERFELGASTLLFVNLREQAAAEAEMALIDALAEAHVAVARVLTSSGESLAALDDESPNDR